MRISRAVIAVCLTPLIAAGCASGGNYRGYGEVDRSALAGGPPSAEAGACYAKVVKPPVVRSAYRGGDGPRPGYRKVTKVVTERVGGGGGGKGAERTIWVNPNRVPANARVLAQRARDGMLLVVVRGGGGGEGRLVKRTVTKYVPISGGDRSEKVSTQVAPARAVWARVVCDDPASAGKIKAAQQRLARLGYYGGPIDGRYNRDFNRAVTAYQEKNRLAVGGLTRQTARRLGVRF